MRFRLRISITRASGRSRFRSAANCSSVKPPGCLVVQLDALHPAADEGQRQRDIIGDAFGAKYPRRSESASLCGSSIRARTSIPCWNTMISGLALKSGDSRMW